MKQVVWMFAGLVLIGVPAYADLNGALDTKITLRLEDADLQEVLDSFSATYDINIVLDNRVVAPAGEKVAKPYVTDGKIGYLKRTDFPLRDVLTALLKPLNLMWVTRENYVWVSTPVNIRHEAFEDLETRVYVLQDDKVPDINADIRNGSLAEVDAIMLMRLVIPVMLEPITGKELSYLRYNLETRQVVVHNTPENHKKIEQLLDLVMIDS